MRLNQSGAWHLTLACVSSVRFSERIAQVALLNPMMLIALAQRSRLFRWLLGLHNFSLMPTEPGQDPVRRLQVRMMTTLAGALAFLFTVLLLSIAGIAALLGAQRPAGWIMIVGGSLMLLLSGWAGYRSFSGKMPTPGATVIALAASVLAIIGGALLVIHA